MLVVNFRMLLRTIVDFSLPPRCPACGAIVDADHRFCMPCWNELEILSGKGCVACNMPMPGFGEAMCAPCMANAPRHDGVRAAVAYGDIARTVALKLKYARRTGLSITMASIIRHHIDEEGLLVPVPLHRWRIWGRGFNQASLIARALSTLSGLTVVDDVLIRKRATQPLRGMSAKQRANSVRGVFRVTRRLSGETIWLVDDVYTSGATTNACAAALKRAGAGRVIVLAWARVVRED